MSNPAEFVAPEPQVFEEELAPARQRVPRGVDATGRVSLGGHRYHVGRWLALETVELALRDGLVEIFHRGAIVATHAQRHQKGKEPPALRERPPQRRPIPKTKTVTRKVDTSGAISFAAPHIGSATRIDG